MRLCKSQAVLERCIALNLKEIRSELQSSDIDEKHCAAQKLCYINMLGYQVDVPGVVDMVIMELMSQSKNVEYKRDGYMLASMMVSSDSSCQSLLINQVRKDLASPYSVEVCMALEYISQVANDGSVSHYRSDVVRLIVKPQRQQDPIVLSKAILSLHAIVKACGLDKQIVELMVNILKSDQDQRVINSVVTLLGDLVLNKALRSEVLVLAPALFKLLITVKNNWLLIKIIRILGQLAFAEPRLYSRLRGPLQKILQFTPAPSVIYECVAVLSRDDDLGTDNKREIVQKCLIFFRVHDVNLYLAGLRLLIQLSAVDVSVLNECKQQIMTCAQLPDEQVQTLAYQLISRLINVDNVQTVVNRMLQNANAVVVKQIIQTLSSNEYALVTDASWFCKVLRQLIDYSLLLDGDEDIFMYVDSLYHFIIGYVDQCKNLVDQIEVLQMVWIFLCSNLSSTRRISSNWIVMMIAVCIKYLDVYNDFDRLVSISIYQSDSIELQKSYAQVLIFSLTSQSLNLDEKTRKSRVKKVEQKLKGFKGMDYERSLLKMITQDSFTAQLSQMDEEQIYAQKVAVDSVEDKDDQIQTLNKESVKTQLLSLIDVSPLQDNLLLSNQHLQSLSDKQNQVRTSSPFYLK
ncbi:hypothetical protein MIR68_007529 [Amoeboaphelidium protococcarum]|nr:hypothetical protein MIR68_007529 [Amoeboaphelidium protococcarum]